jgi:hypothetical protein
MKQIKSNEKTRLKKMKLLKKRKDKNREAKQVKQKSMLLVFDFVLKILVFTKEKTSEVDSGLFDKNDDLDEEDNKTNKTFENDFS